MRDSVQGEGNTVTTEVQQAMKSPTWRLGRSSKGGGSDESQEVRAPDWARLRIKWIVILDDGAVAETATAAGAGAGAGVIAADGLVESMTERM